MSEEKELHIVRVTWTAKVRSLWTVMAKDEEDALRVAKHQAVLAPHQFEPFNDAPLPDELEAEYCKRVADTEEENDREVSYSNVAECPKCDNFEEIPADEQRWHMKMFTHVQNLDDAVGYQGTAVYRCNVCGCAVISEIQADEEEE